MTKKKSFISLVLAFCLIIPAMFMLTACGGNNTPPTLKSPDGIVVEGGNFEDGVVLETSEIDSESPDYKTTISLIESEDYDADKPVYIFEISVKKDNVKVQPNGKVKVSVPIDTDLTGYDVLHIKDDGKIERLSVTYKNGKASFETDSFSKFVFVKKATPAPTPDDSGDDTKTKYTFKASVQEYTGVDDIGTISENDSVVDLTTGREVADGTKITLTATAKEGYALKGWYKVVEGETDTLISCATTYEFNVKENMNIKAVFDEKVTIKITAGVI